MFEVQTNVPSYRAFRINKTPLLSPIKSSQRISKPQDLAKYGLTLKRQSGYVLVQSGDKIDFPRERHDPIRLGCSPPPIDDPWIDDPWINDLWQLLRAD